MLYLHFNNIIIEVYRFDMDIDRNIKIDIDINKWIVSLLINWNAEISFSAHRFVSLERLKLSIDFIISHNFLRVSCLNNSHPPFA